MRRNSGTKATVLQGAGTRLGVGGGGRVNRMNSDSVGTEWGQIYLKLNSDLQNGKQLHLTGLFESLFSEQM